jgi:hypothetical protein
MLVHTSKTPSTNNLTYELPGCFTSKCFNYANPKFRRHLLFTRYVVCKIACVLLGSTTLRCFIILPPASSYIIIPPGGIIMYGIASCILYIGSSRLYKKASDSKKSDAFLLSRHTLEASDYSKIGPFLHNLGDPTIYSRVRVVEIFICKISC